VSELPKFAYDADPPHRDLPPLLLVHGLLVDRRVWEGNAALSERFRVIRVDLPAHGASPAPVTPHQARPKSIAAGLDAVRAELGIDRWRLCGQSFGAAMTLRYAIDFPDRCLCHVFTNANGAWREPWSDAYRQSHEALVADVNARGHDAIARMPYHPRLARRFDPEVRDALAAAADAIDPAGLALLLQEATPRMSVRSELDRLTVPTMLVNGLRERRFQPTRDWLAQACPDMRIVDLAGGHSINVDCPAAFNAAVAGFLSPISGA